MAKEQKGFIVYGDVKAVADELSDEQLGKLFRGMIEYFVSGKTPKFSDILKYVFIPIKQQMDRDSDKYVKKCEKMRDNVNKRWKNDTNVYNGIQLNTNDTNTNTKTNTNKDKDKDTNTMSSETDVSSLSLFLIEYLNEKAGTDYVLDDTVPRRVQTLLDSGYTENQLRTVIDKKCTEWLNDPVMRQYLRPSTLFGDKFGEYLAAPIPLEAERRQKQAESRESLERQLEEKRSVLVDLKESLPAADKTERRHLREQIAILEDSIGLIERRLA